MITWQIVLLNLPHQIVLHTDQMQAVLVHQLVRELLARLILQSRESL